MKEHKGYKEPKILICRYCKQEYILKYRVTKKYLLTRKFCSRKCQDLGIIPWNKGIPRTKKEKKKISLSKIGQKSFRKGKSYPEISGNKHWKWKGGITPLAEIIRNFFEMGEWKKQIFQRDNFTCQKCFRRGSIVLHSHHIKSFNLILQEFLQEYSQFSPMEDKETLIRLAITYKPFWDINNGKTLCKKCHRKSHITWEQVGRKNEK